MIEVNGYTLVYQPKIDRAIAKVGKDDLVALATEYDKLGGLIVNEDNEKVENGVFYKAFKGLDTPVEDDKGKGKKVVVKKGKKAAKKAAKKAVKNIDTDETDAI